MQNSRNQPEANIKKQNNNINKVIKKKKTIRWKLWLAGSNTDFNRKWK